jgi:hypothetical protein
VAVIDHRPKINGVRVVTFKGVRYSQGVSALSGVSRVFYTLIERKADFNNDGWDVEELYNDELLKVSIKMTKTLDRIDSFDTESLAEKLEQLKTWLLQNQDFAELIDCSLLTSKIKEYGLDVQKTVQILKDEFWLRDVPAIGKFGVK